MLLDYLVKSETRKRLLGLFLNEGLEGSVHSLSKIASASYAVTYDELMSMKAAELVKEVQRGRAKIFSLNEDYCELDLLKKLFDAEKATKVSRDWDKESVKASLVFYGAPLQEKGKSVAELSLEETLVLGVLYSKQESYLLRTLPLVLWRHRKEVSFDRLMHFALKYDIKREVGFVLDLTGKLSKYRKFSKEAGKFVDGRHRKSESFFQKARITGAQTTLEELNTPRLARKWLFTMNVGMDSFESFFEKFKAV
ncbi:MAG: hypothetical protein H6626_00150 [Pseudobdellovibrionaceae bacterium]|nr:hypothetical protein [Bdellovibrionales bacterium]USN47544.1 MAG: hypothetical protein H6626_00150 [Pseudobdellovibrionaceae bacterium]